MDTLIRLLAEASQLGWAVAVLLIGVVVSLAYRLVTVSKEGAAASDRNTETIRTINDRHTEMLVALMKERHERELAYTQQLSEVHGRIHTLVQIIDERIPRQRP